VQYQEYQPTEALRKYVKCYYSIRSDDNEIIEDKAFATGCIEVMFSLHGRPWQTKQHDIFTDTSSVELWGQILKPMTFRSAGKTEILGIRFYPATASFFLKEDISRFNNNVLSLSDVLGRTIKGLHAQLQDETSIHRQIGLVDSYLMNALNVDSKSLVRIDLVQRVMNEVTHRDFFDNIENVARRYGMSSRYLQKLFVQYTGLTPKLFSRINRFQNSLVLISKGNISLTDASYECGYFDQSHFIREFKSFTDLSPSAFVSENSTAILASPNKQ
jgi:AraC-like DNA-binding protein